MTKKTADWYLPADAYGLIKYLARKYPARCIKAGEPLEDAHRYAGKRELVEELLAQMEEETGASSDR